MLRKQTNMASGASKSGIGTSVGKPGATANYSRQRIRTSAGGSGNGLTFSNTIHQQNTSRNARQNAEDARRDQIRRYRSSAATQGEYRPQSIREQIKGQFDDISSETQRLRNSINLPTRKRGGFWGPGRIFRKNKKRGMSTGKKILIAIVIILLINFLIISGIKK